MPSTDHVIELFSSQKGRHPPLSLSLSPSLSLACTCFVSVCFLFARQSACRKLPTCQVASSASQLDAASFIHSLTVSAFPLSVRSSISLSVCLLVCSGLAGFVLCIFIRKTIWLPLPLTTMTSCCSFVSAYRASLAYNFYLLLIQLQNCSLIAHIS